MPDSTSVEVEAFQIKVPAATSRVPVPVTESVVLIDELAPSVRLPPEITSGSYAVRLFAACAPEEIVIVGPPDTLMTTSSLAVGTPSLQLAATSQDPPLGLTQVSVERSCRRSKPSKRGRLNFLGRREGRRGPPRTYLIENYPPRAGSAQSVSESLTSLYFIHRAARP